jgi:hypothetical protein
MKYEGRACAAGVLPLIMHQKLPFLALFILGTTLSAFGWGQIGHRIVGEVATAHLKPCVEKKISAILQGESLAMCSTWMDEIKSDKAYDHWDAWHYCTIGDHQTYAEAGTPSQGDILMKLDEVTRELETKKFKHGGEAAALKMLVHLLGDLHQPLHVGRGDDKGGNDVKLKYFGKSTNLHRIWDSDLIDGQQLSYTEYSQHVLRTTPQDRVKQYQSGTYLDWANESKALRMAGIYPATGIENLSYEYGYQNYPRLEERLVQAGVRLAMVLNRIYAC